MRALAFTACLCLYTPGVIATNSYAQVNAPSGGYITWMSGRFNVPGKPQASSQATGQPMYLWPGLDVYGQDCGLWQPVLGFSDQQGNWWLSNWFSNCPGVSGGYCHDPPTTVSPGDQIYFWIKQDSGLNYEMGYQVQSTGATKVMRKPCKYRLPTSAWTIECETYFTPSANTREYMPTTEWQMWDITVRDQNNNELSGQQQCHPTADRPLSCSGNRCTQWYNAVDGLTGSGMPRVADCKGNKACEDVDGYIPGRVARAAFGLWNETFGVV